MAPANAWTGERVYKRFAKARFILDRACAGGDEPDRYSNNDHDTTY